MSLPYNHKLILIMIIVYMLVVACTCTLYSPLDPRIRISGRYYSANTSILYDWPCFRIQFCFENATQIVLHIHDQWNVYSIAIDGNLTRRIHPRFDTKVTIFQQKDVQSHCLQIIKTTENHYGPLGTYRDSRITAIEILGTNADLVNLKSTYKYQLEFFGDSDTNGFGTVSNNTYLCALNMKSIQNCLQSWATHLSQKLNAQSRMEAWSGKGVYQNAFGITGPPMPQYWTKVTSNAGVLSYDFSDQFVPDAVFIQLGDNDFSSVIPPTLNQFVDAYVQMLSQITDTYWIHKRCQPKIINICNGWIQPKHCLYVKTAVESFHTKYAKTYYIEIPDGTVTHDLRGCVGHINLKGQKKIAEYLFPIVSGILEEGYVG